MTRLTNLLTLFVVLIFCIAWTGCGADDNPLTPTQLAGTYTLVSFADVAGNVTVRAGDILDLDGPGALPEGAITGSLELTETTATFIFTVTPAGSPPTTAIGDVPAAVETRRRLG